MSAESNKNEIPPRIRNELRMKNGWYSIDLEEPEDIDEPKDAGIIYSDPAEPVSAPVVRWYKPYDPATDPLNQPR